MPHAQRVLRRTAQFKRDAKLMVRRGKDLGKLREPVESLATGGTLDERYRDHALVGGYRGSRECHIEPDWLLIYERSEHEVILIRTGTHADLFGT